MSLLAGGGAAQSLRFLVSGGSAFALYYLLALALRHFTSWPDGVCATVATLLAIPPAFLMQKHFTFRHAGNAHGQLFAYALLQGVCALLTGAVAQLCARLGLTHFLGFFLGGVAGVLLSYLVQSALIFKKK